jgi:CRP/FNR family transcriptional regulator, cyclic AMP receptor protein
MMERSAPVKPVVAAAPGYNAAMALEFFRAAGKPQTVAAGETIFEENDKGNRLLLRRDKMYLLLEGEVTLTKGARELGKVKVGEIFGEMAPVSDAPRSASAIAKTPCRLIGLDARQFQAALQKKPEFGLMVMSLMIGRLRDILSGVGVGEDVSEAALRDSRVFDRKLLADLLREFRDDAMLRYEAGKTIVREGQAGVLMYVVVEGRVAVSIQGKLIERLGPGAVFGEMALVERTPRLASAVAEIDCMLLAINRNAFLDLVKTRPEFGASVIGAVAERARGVTARVK